ncbi:NifU family protein [Nitrospirillum iridis]|uniref:Fe-S cluster biogenesis protein NfuA n=1 Tax=Nitrospirillum iridis TaxID=765888 RepID=A0A7X0B4E6_9PROT|nr:NifU family protein [Nitrospirillum iridis]MBB6254485.1 Fe-S cluster biogenesis protein NfuA [Nitrospirillum iridis]
MLVPVSVSEPSEVIAPAEDPRVRIIQDAIAEIRPALRRDGGDCEFLGIEGDTVRVRLAGACVMCRLSSATLEGIQARVVEKLGAFVRLVPVIGPPGPSH